MARLVSAIALMVVVAACGGDDGAGDAGSSDATSTTAGTTTAAPGSDFVPPDLEDTSWNVVLYQLPVGGMANLWPDTEINLLFSDDGTFSGFSGCNTYTGTFTVDGPYHEEKHPFGDHLRGQGLQLGDLAWTERACTGPNLVMEQEDEYLQAFGSAGNWYINDDGNLILQAADGLFRLEAEPAA